MPLPPSAPLPSTLRGRSPTPRTEASLRQGPRRMCLPRPRPVPLSPRGRGLWPRLFRLPPCSSVLQHKICTRIPGNTHSSKTGTRCTPPSRHRRMHLATILWLVNIRFILYLFVFICIFIYFFLAKSVFKIQPKLVSRASLNIKRDGTVSSRISEAVAKIRDPSLRFYVDGCDELATIIFENNNSKKHTNTHISLH